MANFFYQLNFIHVEFKNMTIWGWNDFKREDEAGPFVPIMSHKKKTNFKNSTTNCLYFSYSLLGSFFLLSVLLFFIFLLLFIFFHSWFLLYRFLFSNLDFVLYLWACDPANLNLLCICNILQTKTGCTKHTF